jgi:glycosyltransferase involved in cell wall biosynthesis
VTLVSAIMPTFRGEHLVTDALDSALAQTHRPLEVVVVDDGSDDATTEVVADYARRHPDVVRLIAQPDRAGPCRRRNDALQAARGELIAWLDQDDVWLPDKLARQVALLEADRGAGLAYCDYEEFDGASGRTLPSEWPHGAARGDILGDLWVDGCFICSSTVVFRRAALAARGLRFPERDFSFGDDYWTWLALSLDWRAARVDEVLVRYRRHPGNESRRRPRENFHLRRIELLRDFVEEFPEARERLAGRRREGLARHAVRAAKFELGLGRRRRAAACALRALSQHPGVVAERVLGEARRALTGA